MCPDASSNPKATEAAVKRFESTFGDSPTSVDAGIPRVTDDNRPPPVEAADALRRLLSTLSTTDLRSSLAVLDEYRAGDELRNALFETGMGAWRVPISSLLRGRCLDVNAGFGTRACLLAESTDEVYAVDASLDALRFLRARDDYEDTAPIIPIHGTVETLPTPSDPFDTVVLDHTGGYTPDDAAASIRYIRPFVASDGTLVVLFDSWLRRTGITNALGIGRETDGCVTDQGIKDATARRYRRLLTREGFESVDLYALLPDAHDPTFCFRVDDAAARKQLLETELDPTTKREQLVRWLADVANGTPMLSECYPSYLAVCRPSPGSNTGTGGLVISARTRSVLLEREHGSLSHVTKFPTRRAHEAYVTAESEVLDSLADADVDLVSTFPTGTTVTTELGSARVEAPVAGEPLVRRITHDVERFSAVLDIGFEWLTRFQLAYGGKPSRRSPKEVAEELSFPEGGVDAPPTERAVSVFETPIHGDYHPKNVFVEDDNLTAVIDWELASDAGNPMVDAGFFVLQTAAAAFEGLNDGIDTALCTPGPHARAVADVLDRYGDAVGLSRNAILTYFPAVWVHRLRTARARNATMSYTEHENRRIADLERLFERRQEIRQALDW